MSKTKMEIFSNKEKKFCSLQDDLFYAKRGGKNDIQQGRYNLSKCLRELLRHSIRYMTLVGNFWFDKKCRDVTGYDS